MVYLQQIYEEEREADKATMMLSQNIHAHGHRKPMLLHSMALTLSPLTVHN